MYGNRIWASLMKQKKLSPTLELVIILPNFCYATDLQKHNIHFVNSFQSSFKIRLLTETSPESFMPDCCLCIFYTHVMHTV